MRKFSLVIITKNEAKNIETCLASVKGLTDDIVVFDSGSTDGTQEICKTFGANVYQHDFVDFSSQKNAANSAAKYDWVLSLDADEAMDEEMRDDFLRQLELNDNSLFQFNRLTYYCGHWVKHCGWYPDWKLRFFDRRKMKWEGSIHEILSPVNKGEKCHAKRVKGNLLHYSYHSIEDHHKQAEKFTRMKAEKMRELGKNDGFWISAMSGIWKFLQIYCLKLGFLDGKSGFQIAEISAKYAVRRYRF